MVQMSHQVVMEEIHLLLVTLTLAEAVVVLGVVLITQVEMVVLEVVELVTKVVKHLEVLVFLDKETMVVMVE